MTTPSTSLQFLEQPASGEVPRGQVQPPRSGNMPLRTTRSVPPSRLGYRGLGAPYSIRRRMTGGQQTTGMKKKRAVGLKQKTGRIPAKTEGQPVPVSTTVEVTAMSLTHPLFTSTPMPGVPQPSSSHTVPWDFSFIQKEEQLTQQPTTSHTVHHYATPVTTAAPRPPLSMPLAFGGHQPVSQPQVWPGTIFSSQSQTTTTTSVPVGTTQQQTVISSIGAGIPLQPPQSQMVALYTPVTTSQQSLPPVMPPNPVVSPPYVPPAPIMSSLPTSSQYQPVTSQPAYQPQHPNYYQPLPGVQFPQPTFSQVPPQPPCQYQSPFNQPPRVPLQPLQPQQQVPPPAFPDFSQFANALTQVVQQQQQQTKNIVSRQSQSNKLIPFGGNPVEWPLFCHRYLQSTQDCAFTPSENISRLGDALRGEAKKYVQPLLIMPNSDPNAVMAKLQQRYGKPELIINTLMESVKKMPTQKEDKLHLLLDFASSVSNLVASIKSMGAIVHLHNPTLMKELVDKLPGNLKVQWGAVAMWKPYPSLEDFSTWLEQVSNAVSQVTVPTYTPTEQKKKGKGKGNTTGVTITEVTSDTDTTAATVTEPDKKKEVQCVICQQKNHHVLQCSTFKKMDVDARWAKAKELRLCFRCLRPKCSLQTCKSKSNCRVEGCSRRHHTLLHGSGVRPAAANANKEVENVPPSTPATAATQRSSPPPSEDNNHVRESRTTVLFRVIPVTLYGPGGTLNVNALVDEASSVSMMSREVARKLQLSGPVDPLRLNWTNSSTQVDNNSRRVKCQIGPANSNKKFRLHNVRTVENLSLPSVSKSLGELATAYAHLRDVPVADSINEKPALLIGLPHIHLTVARTVREGKPGEPIATETKLGWVIYGPTVGVGDGAGYAITCFHQSDDDIIHHLVKESFSLDSIGVQSRATSRSREDIRAEQLMSQVTRRVGLRWETGLLWRDPPETWTKPLPNSYGTAYRRLLGLERKLKRDPVQAEAFQAKIQHYLDKGYALKLTPEEAAKPNPRQWFLPIFAVFNPNKPDKLRIVWDAAAKSEGRGLNDFLMTGPDLLTNIVSILLNFRLKKVAFMGDIAEMFHQVRIREEDQPAQRFLWRDCEDRPPDVYQLTVMMFGACDSPYKARYVNIKNAEEFRGKCGIDVDAANLQHYVDDYADSADSPAEAIKTIKAIRHIHLQGGFEMGKWISNSPEVLQELAPEDRLPAAKDLTRWSELPTERALGLHWDPKDDSLLFKLNIHRAGEGIASGDEIPTKRDILRLIMLIWDPLGLLNHYVIQARILQQQLWRSQLGWDEEVPVPIFHQWRKWVRKLKEVEAVRLPRCYSEHTSTSQDVQLHVFADASELAYCAVAYLRIQTPTGVIVRFVLSKCRVAPLKPASIPRLELQAALLAARIGKFINENLRVKIISTTFWTDSQTVLKWIQSEARRYQQFVSNRVGEIQEITEVEQWRWIPSKMNPADDGTRDGSCDLSSNSRWWRGPDFLVKEENEWPQQEAEPEVQEDELELRKEYVAVSVSAPQFAALPEVDRFSKYQRLLRATAYVILACAKFSRKPEVELPLDKAKSLLIKRSQWESYPVEMELLSNNKPIPKSSHIYTLTPILDEEGVMRMKSRLSGAEEEGIRRPVILSKKNKLTKLLILFFHSSHMHAGVDYVRNMLRQEYWIPNIQSAVKEAIRSCMECRIRKVKCVPPQMGDIPDFRLRPQPRPFTYTGMDYFGPLFVTQKRSTIKVYGVIFTCMHTRAVHLELASDLTTDACIMAIRRMVARRGKMKVLWSDNGTNLRGAEKELREALEELNQTRMKEELEVRNIIWRCTPPSSPHFGSLWERMVRSVKTALYTVLKSQAPKEEVLHTLLLEVESMVNSRPLTDVPFDPESREALTPFHFLIGTPSGHQPPGVFNDKDLLLSKRWKHAQVLADHFWRRWVKEVIPNLQRRTKWHESQPNLAVGDIVVLFDESLRRGTYPLAEVEEVIFGKDGVGRVCRVRTASGVYMRPVVKLGRLGISSLEGHQGQLQEVGGEGYVAENLEQDRISGKIQNEDKED